MLSHWCDNENENCGMEQNVKKHFLKRVDFSTIEALDTKKLSSLARSAALCLSKTKILFHTWNHENVNVQSIS